MSIMNISSPRGSGRSPAAGRQTQFDCEIWPFDHMTL